MLIIGAKGFAKEILEVLHINDNIANIAFVTKYSIFMGGKQRKQN